MACTTCRYNRGVEFPDASYIYNFEDSCCCKKHRHCDEDDRHAEPLAIPVDGHENRPCGCGCKGVKHSCCDREPTSCDPVDCDNEALERSYRVCCDRNGVCCKYSCRCRDPFWPEFAHPRWLCCAELYSGNDCGEA